MRFPHRFAAWVAVPVLGAALVLGACEHGSVSKNIATKGTNKPTIARSLNTTSSGPSRGASRRGSSHGSAPSPTTRAAPSWSLVIEPNDGMEPIYSLMSSARHTLDMTMYELDDATTVGILEADARRGVRVRVLLDQDYSGLSINEPAYSQLGSNGVQVRWAPAQTIFHQKTITVDDHTSAIMTLNLTSDYYTTTRDFAVITTDRPDVSAIEQVFDEDWTDSGPPVSGPTGQNLVWSPGAEGSIISLIESAHHSLLVENEEMDDSDITDALESAARRGVDVEVVMTDSSSWVDTFDALASAGVHVRTYSPDASLYIHAKVVVADDRTLFLGSQNFSVSSLDYNRELGIITTDQALVGPVYRTVMSDFNGGAVFTVPSATLPTATTTARSTPSTNPTADAWCAATASAANDGYNGDYDVHITSNRPYTEATASDSTDHWSDETDGSGDVVIKLYYTYPGESITVKVGAASCSTAA